MAVSRSARRTGQVLTGLGALVVLGAVLVGAPIALVTLAGNPLPTEMPTLDTVSTALTSRDDGQLFLRALAVLGWFGWATFAFSVLVELVSQVLRRPTPKLPGLRSQQRAAAALLGSIALIAVASPAAAATSTGYGPPVTTYATAAPAVTTAAPADASTTDAPARGVAPVQQQATEQPQVYRVAKGDYLGEVAERYLEDFQSYRVLVKLNKLGNPDRIYPGQLLRLPDQASDKGVRPHATGRLVGKPSPRPIAPPASPVPDVVPEETPKKLPDQAPRQVTPPPTTNLPQQEAPPVTDLPREEAPPMTVGAARHGQEDRVNRPLAVSAVLAVASIVGAQIGTVLGLRRRAAGPAGGRSVGSGRHRRD